MYVRRTYFVIPCPGWLPGLAGLLLAGPSVLPGLVERSGVGFVFIWRTANRRLKGEGTKSERNDEKGTET